MKTKRLIWIIILVIIATVFFGIEIMVAGCSSCNNEDHNEPDDTVIIKKLKISEQYIQLETGDSAELTLTNAEGEIKWVTADENVATVSDGVVYAVGIGRTKITVFAENGKAFVDVYVTAKFEDKTAVELNTKAIRLYKGDDYELTLMKVVGNKRYPTDSAVWSTSDKTVATVSDEGIVTACNIGEAVITAEIKIDGVTYNKTCTVETILVTEIELNNESVIFVKGENNKLDITCNVYDGEKTEIPLSELSFESSDSNFTIKPDGTFSFINGGSVALTVSYKNYCSKTFILEMYDKLISNAEEFLSIANNTSGYYMLIDDVCFDGAEFAQIASFRGVLNGNGYSVSDFVINSSVGGTAMFGEMAGIIKNLSIENVTLNPIWGMTGRSAIIAGVLSGRLENVYISGRVKGVNATVMPWADYTTWGLRSGAICATAYGGSMKNCVLNFTFDEGTDVTLLSGSGATLLENVYAYSQEGVLTSFLGEYAVINGEFVTGEMTEVLEKAEKLNGKVFDINVENVDLNEDVDYVVPGEMATVRFYKGDEVIKTMEIRQGRVMRTPTNVYGDDLVYSFNYDFPTIIEGDLDIRPTFYTKISTVDQLCAISGSDGVYLLTADIDGAGEIYENTSFLGDFSGVLDGNGYSVKNIAIKPSDKLQICALFNNMSGTVRNIGFEGITIKASDDGYVPKSGLFANVFTGTINNVLITAVYESGSVTANYCQSLLAVNAGGSTAYNVRIHVDNLPMPNPYIYALSQGDYPAHYGNYYASYTGERVNNWGGGEFINRDVGDQCLEPSKAGGDSQAIARGFSDMSFWDVDDNTCVLKKNVYGIDNGTKSVLEALPSQSETVTDESKTNENGSTDSASDNDVKTDDNVDGDGNTDANSDNNDSDPAIDDGVDSGWSIVIPFD